MAFQLPPWLNISPEQFTHAAIAGGAQGFQAAAQAGELAQRGLLEGAKLAQDAAARAAEIAVRREQINASLAENAARVSAARAEAAAQNAIRQQDLVFRQQAQQDATQQAAAELAAKQELGSAGLATREKIANIRAGEGYEPPQLLKLQAALQQALASGDKKTAAEIQGQINRIIAEPQKPGLRITAPLDPSDPTAALHPPSISGPMELVQEFRRTNSPAMPGFGGSTNLWDQFNAWRK